MPASLVPALAVQLAVALSNAVSYRFEKLAEDCKRSMDTLKQAFARSLPTPSARFEQRTFSVIK